MRSSHQDPVLEQIYAILGNPYMRAILLTVGEREEVSFSELKAAVGTSTGNLYYNLDKLSGFITKNERRKYILTEKGERLYKYVLENEVRLKSLVSERRGLGAFIENRVIPILVPESLAALLYSDLRLSVLAAAIYAFVSAAAVLYGSYIVLGLDQSFPPPVAPYRLALLLAGWLLLLLTLEASSRLLGGRKKVSLDYVSTVTVSTVPLYAPAFLPADPFATNLVFRLLQALVIGLLTAALKVYKKMPAERAFVAVFIAYYACFTLSLVLQRVL